MLDTTCDSTVTMGNVTLTAASDDAVNIDVSENTDGTVTMGNVTVVTGDYTRLHRLQRSFYHHAP